MDKTNKNPIFSIKNFRSFGEDGADFELAPIAVLTGCNSAGKSSLVKAQLLLGNVVQSLPKGNYSFACLPININTTIRLNTSNKELALGNYHKVLNRTSKDGIITIAYSMHSNYLAEDVKVVFDFVEYPNNVEGDGLLQAVRIEKLDGTVIFSNQDLQAEGEERLMRDNQIFDCAVILENYKRYLLFSHFEELYNSDHSEYFTDDELIRIEKAKEPYKHFKLLCENNRLIKVDGNTIKLFRDARNFDKMPRFRHEIKLPDTETTELFLENNSFYCYLPALRDVGNKDIHEVRKYLIQKMKDNDGKYNNPEKIHDWIQYFCDDLESSSYSTFKDYFHTKEREHLKTGIFRIRNKSSYDIDALFLERFERNENGDMVYSPIDPSENRLSRSDYDEILWFPATIEALETICYGGFRFEYGAPEYKKYNIDLPKDYRQLTECLEEYCHMVANECFSPIFLEKTKYIDSSSVSIKRLYSIDEKDKIGDCFKTFLNGNRQTILNWGVADRKEYTKYSHGTFINNWIKRFEIGEKLLVTGTEEGLGILVYLVKDGEKRLLADEGYGISQLIALLLQIENSILTATLYTEGRIIRKSFKHKPSVIFVEEPEVHLHPKYQSLLADMFVEAYQKYNIRFIIETHSEYLIRKLQVMVADKDCNLSSDDVSLNYVEKDERGISHNRQIKILEDGRLSDPFGHGFYDEADTLAMELMKYKARKK